MDPSLSAVMLRIPRGCRARPRSGNNGELGLLRDLYAARATAGSLEQQLAERSQEAAGLAKKAPLELQGLAAQRTR